ncbi:MAG TPA: type I polyketide synthase, partial [Methylomirabilota bacterium]|nr:type I polyketide synthase [Methylomirabilota bacterium]
VDYSNAFVVDPSASDIQLMTGNTLSIVSNRISYVFDLKGPSFTVDTACSSSIVALHEAMEAMRTGRIDTAIVGGVNLLLSPFAFIGFSRASMLSPTGLCRAFDADGDGYVRSEGAVAFVLKTVEAAQAAGDPIRGVLVGSGINSDGRTTGLSLPSSEQQAALLRHVYDRFEVDPEALAYVEAHGTGTRVGDPAEANALGAVLGRRRGARLPIGSVKTNIGHLEAASGLAGLLKAQLVLEKRKLPASLHFDTPNPDIAFDDLNIEVVTKTRPLADTGTPLYVGINSFGFGGANAHAVLRQPAAHEMGRRSSPTRVVPLVVSAQSPEALKQLAATWRDRLDGADTAETARLTNAAAYTRDRLDHRLVALGSTSDEIQTALDHYLDGVRASDVVAGRAAARTAPVAFVFSGNGSQWSGMGRAAYQGDAAFRTAFDTVTRLFIRTAGWSLLTTLFSADLESDLERTEIAQPLLFAVQVATVEALAARGLRPDMVAGHSVGEVAAAWASGALTLEAAVFLIHVRSTQQEVTRHLGGMAALLVSAADARGVFAELGFRTIELAADNSPRSVTLSGTHEELADFAKVAKKRRLALRKLKLDYPFHCALIEPIKQPLTAALATLQPRETSTPYVSAVTGNLARGEELGAEYWWRNVRQPVMFRAAVETLAEMGAKVFLEIGPKPVLQTYVADTLAGANRTGTFVASLDTNDDQVDGTLFGLVVARAVVNGARVDDERFFGPRATVHIPLPRYPWQNQPYRVEQTAEAVDLFGHQDDHPLLGYRLRAGIGPWTSHIDPVLVPWLADHKVESSTVFPAAGFIEMVLSAARATLGDGPIEIRDFDIIRPMVMEDGEPVETRTEVDPSGHIVEIESRRRLAGDDWAMHVRARIARPPIAETEKIAVPETEGEGLDHDALYELTRRFGLDYGPAFRRTTRIAPIDETSLLVDLSSEQASVVGDADHVLHPTLLDASFHGLFWLITRMVGDTGDSSFLPVRIGDLRVYLAGRTPSAAIVTVNRASPRSIEATFTLIEADGTVVARASGVRFKAVLLNRAANPDDFIFTTRAVRLGDAGEVVRLPDDWAEPLARLSAIGVAATSPPDQDDAQLLIDAGCRAAAREAIASLADDDGLVDPTALVESGVLAHGSLALLHRLADALEEDGALEQTDAGYLVSADCPYPPAETIIATLVACHPRRIAEAMALVRLGDGLPKRFTDGLVDALDAVLPNALADHLDTSAPVSAPMHRAIAVAAEDFARAWPTDCRLQVLLVGGDCAALALRLAAMPSVSGVVVTDPSQSRLDRISLDLATGNGIEVVAFDEIGDSPHGRREFDAVFAAGLVGRAESTNALSAIRQRMADGGVLMSVEPEATLFADSIFGQAS